jgi:hypothetical protein
MSRQVIDRREFLALSLAGLLVPSAHAHAEGQAQKSPYDVDVSLLYGALTYHIEGTLTETIDRAAGRYDVTIAGEGDGIANRVESTGTLRQGRWAPLRTRSSFRVKGRESRSDIAYDHARRRIEYHFKGETFFLRRLRVADDVVSVPEGFLVDDSISGTLNYADQRWPTQPDGSFLTHVVRRKRAGNEGVDEVQKHYRAELVPFRLQVTVDAETRKPIAKIDLTRFSSWATQDQPALITFGADRRPEHMSLSLMLGTSVQIRLKPA